MYTFDICYQGNLFLLRDMMGWYGDKVLYFGDHVYTDLAVGDLYHNHMTVNKSFDNYHITLNETMLLFNILNMNIKINI